MTATLLEIAAVGLVLLGILYEEKLVELERRAANRLLDAIAFCIAKVIVLCRRRNSRLAPMPGVKVYTAPKHHRKTNLVCNEFEM